MSQSTLSMSLGGRSVATSQAAGMKYISTLPPSLKEMSTTVDDNLPIFAEPENFEGMVSDLRRSFIGWLKRTEMDLRRERDTTIMQKKEIEDNRMKMWKLFQEERSHVLQKIKDERTMTESELAVQIDAINAEREESHERIQEEKGKSENEKELQRKHMQMEREKFRHEFESFDMERRYITDTHIATATMIDVNVGGVVFETSRHTLAQQPGSFLEAVVSGRHKLSKDRQGRVFFDRDSETFRGILNFLRNPNAPPHPRDFAESEALMKEATFYGIKFLPYPFVFASGGHNGTKYLRSNEVLDVGQQCWRTCRPMETERAYFGNGVLSQRLFFFGGQNPDYKALCDMEIYDCLRDCWTNGASLNIPRRNLCSTSCGNRIYAIGGFDGSNILSSVEVYDTRMRNWHEVANLLTPRSSAICSEQKGRIFVMGGTNGKRLNTAEVYEPRMNKWEELPTPMNCVRSAAACCSLINHIFAIGGIDDSHVLHNTIEVLTPDIKKWHIVPTLREGRSNCACVGLSDSVLITGGQSNCVLNTTELYAPHNDQWQPGPPMLFPRQGHCLSVASV